MIGVLTAPSMTLADEGTPEETPEATQLEDIVPSVAKPRYRRLDTRLNTMVERSRQVEQLVQMAHAIVGGAPLYEDVVEAVTIRLSDHVSATVGFLEQAGATVANVGTDYVEAYVPITLLPALAEREGVLGVEAIVPPQPVVTSQGTTIHGSPTWNAMGFTGAGVKVGIIDAGFVGFSGLMGSDLPWTVIAHCYTAVGTFTLDLADCETEEIHGTGVAEAVVDIAPDVSLYIANPSSAGDLRSAVAWMVSEGVSVINMSLVWNWDGPGDGTSLYSASPLNTVDLAVAGGAVWTNAAGNHALANWVGSYSDAEPDGWLDFALAVEANPVQLSSGQTLIAQARWDDSWAGAARDFDLYLYDSGLSQVAYSGMKQSGVAGQVPLEIISYTAPVTGTYYLAIFHYEGTAPSWIQLNTLTQQALGVAVADSSVMTPAESASPGMLAVGAASWATPESIEPFSSRGPTSDGRVKPDIVGADRGDSVAYGLGGFAGTSQASPHVAGLAALVRQRFPGFAPAEVASYIKENALPRGAVPNNTWGFGLAQLPPLPPGPPTDVAATAGDGEATVSWSPPLSDGGSPIVQYAVTSTPDSLTAVVEGSTLSATVTGLTNGTAYTFVVTATNAIGASGPSAPSSPVTPTLPPTPIPTPTPVPSTTVGGLIALATDFGILTAVGAGRIVRPGRPRPRP